LPNTTTTIIPQAVNFFYDRVMLRKAVPLFVHLKWAQVRDIPKGAGVWIKFRRYNLLTPATTPLTEGITPPGSQLAYGEVTAAIEQYGKKIIAVLKSSLNFDFAL